MKKYAVLAVGLLISAVAIWYSTRGVDWHAFAQAFGRFNWWMMLPGLAAFYYSMYLRAVRWGLLFQPHHDLKGWQMFRPLMICFAYNSILPGRVGEFVRAWYVGKHMNTGIGTALATVLVERLFDGILLLGMLVGALMLLPPLPENLSLEISYWWIHSRTETLTAENINHGMRALEMLSALLTIGVIVFLIPAVQRLLVWLARSTPGLPARVRTFIENAIGQVARGFGAITRPSVLAKISVQSVVLWVLVAVSNWTIALGFGIPMNFLHATALGTLIGIFIMLPAAPGYWGLYEAGTIFSLMLLNVTQDRSLALAYSVMIHLVQYIPIVVIGLYFARQSKVHAGDATAGGEEEAAEPAEAPTAAR